MTSPRRDKLWIEREFGRDKWPAVLAEIERLEAAGERDLARLVSLVSHWEAGQPDAAAIEILALGRRVALPAALAYPGFYTLVRQILLDLSLQEEPDLIVEVGSGWGRNLANLWLDGGPRHARYLALEYTESGRRCSQALARLAPGFDLITDAFDYYAPSLPDLPRHARALVFTVFSIDQIPQISAAPLQMLSRIADSVTGVHFEPVGWQHAEQAAGKSENNPFKSKTYTETHDYNRNFWPVLKNLEAEGNLVVEQMVPDIFGANPENPASLVVWRRSS